MSTGWSPPLTATGSITWAGRRLGSVATAARAMADEIASGTTGSSTPDAGRGVDATGLAAPETLVTVFAAAMLQRPVLLGPIADEHLPPDGLAESAFLVVSTSGSTMAPRAIVRTAASWTRSFPGYTALSGLTPADRVLVTGPLSSTLQLFAAVHAIACGAEVTDDPQRATAAVCVPTVLPSLVGLPRLRSVVVAGASLPKHVAAQAVSSGIRVAEYYGAAELSFVAARRYPTDPAADVPAFTAFDGVDIDVRDGLIWSRSPYHSMGYLGTDGALRTADDGFATVGDRGVGDSAGLTVLGRPDLAVTVGGRTVQVEDVEAALTALPGVLDAAAVGAPSERWGQHLVAVVVTDGADLAAIRAAARRVLAHESLPRRWLVIEKLPRTSGGKIDRRAVAAFVSQRGNPGQLWSAAQDT